ncbi:hypothetical protein [Brachybacterium sp. FME24]|uniref:hypothetical protein n=1 Tax=Brachybacterium sp. FME24 TaxID=2742605 RepID=UPI00186805E6|nr:hypothetical protein [Brachybacterium sp. FME24]
MSALTAVFLGVGTLLVVLGFLDEWLRGAFAAGPAGLGAVAALSSGCSWHFSRRKEWALNRYGFHKVVDYRFSTRDVNVPLDHVMKMAGWGRPWMRSPRVRW